ncbi:MAG: SGNH/GDSL hydrolase family protein [Treponema sp.]|nr:SGNH/GDSL hydrolase family protein [Treponema sp.]
MRLSNNELKNIYFGAYNFKETEDGYLQAFQYTEDQIAYFKGASDFWYDRCIASTAKTIEFTTEAEKISFDYKILWKGSDDTFEVAVNGIISSIAYVKDLELEGTLEFNITEHLEGVEMNTERLEVVVYLPADATVVIKNFMIDGMYAPPAKKREKVLWIGDSITQGFGPLRSAQTYVSVANRLLDYEIINQGIGGYVYDKKCLMPMPGYKPDKLIVALGTNQYGCETMQDIEEYYPRLFELYGKDIPTLVITPLWRGDNPEGIRTLLRFCDNLIWILKKYPNIKIVDGLELVPHLPEYFLDNLHPNQLGCEVYARNLVQKIKDLGF